LARQPPNAKPKRRQQRQIDALNAEADAVVEEHGEEPEDPEVWQRFDGIQEQIAVLSESEAFWPDSVKAMAGAVVSIGAMVPSTSAVA